MAQALYALKPKTHPAEALKKVFISKGRDTGQAIAFE